MNAFMLALVYLVVVCNLFYVANAYADGSCCDAHCYCDTNLADDEPGQKDLNKMCQLPTPSSFCSDTVNVQTEVSFSWDTLKLTGQNSLDGCALFDDGDADEFANYAFCVSVQGDKVGNDFIVTDATLIYYTCTNGRVDRCTGKQVGGCKYLIGEYMPDNGCEGKFNLHSNATVLVAGTSFSNGDPWDCITEHSDNADNTGCNDTASCVAGQGCVGYDRVADICVSSDDMPVVATMIDVCSYPSAEPNSDPSDCVVFSDCAALNCQSLKCAQQVCDPDLGRCITTTTGTCDDGVSCTTDECVIQCDAQGCYDPPGSSSTGCTHKGGQYSICDPAQPGACCTGLKCLPQGTAKRSALQSLPPICQCDPPDCSAANSSVIWTGQPPNVTWTPTVNGSGIKPGCKDPSSPFYSWPPTPVPPPTQPTPVPATGAPAPPTVAPNTPGGWGGEGGPGGAGGPPLGICNDVVVSNLLYLLGVWPARPAPAAKVSMELCGFRIDVGTTTPGSVVQSDGVTAGVGAAGRKRQDSQYVLDNEESMEVSATIIGNGQREPMRLEELVLSRWDAAVDALFVRFPNGESAPITYGSQQSGSIVWVPGDSLPAALEFQIVPAVGASFSIDSFTLRPTTTSVAEAQALADDANDGDGGSLWWLWLLLVLLCCSALLVVLFVALEKRGVTNVQTSVRERYDERRRRRAAGGGGGGGGGGGARGSNNFDSFWANVEDGEGNSSNDLRQSAGRRTRSNTSRRHSRMIPAPPGGNVRHSRQYSQI